MSSQTQSMRIEVLGLYSPAANVAEYERVVQKWVASAEPEDMAEAEAEIRDHLGNAVMVEALVVNRDERFYVGDFVQPDPTKGKSRWQVAWMETYLTTDGETVIATHPGSEFPSAKDFRIVFFIHYWVQGNPLLSSCGELALPPIEAEPERLFRLVPYVLPS